MIDYLISQNEELWKRFTTDNTACETIALGFDVDEIYQRFAEQDFVYLVERAKFMALRFAKSSKFCSYDLDGMETDSEKIMQALDDARV